MLERFNGTINLFEPVHRHVPQRAIRSKTLILALKKWQKKRRELFKVCGKTGRYDTQQIVA
jgi:hypothetical protein